MNAILVAAALSALALAACTPDLSLQAEAPSRADEKPAGGATIAAPPSDTKDQFSKKSD